MADLSEARRQMVVHQIGKRGVRSSVVARAMQEVPREEFMREEMREFAYADSPLPIGEGQTISQPYIVAYMTEALELEGGERVLEVGTGSGYAAAVLARIADEVYTIERHPALARGCCRRHRHDSAGAWPACRSGAAARAAIGARFALHKTTA